MFSTGDFSSDQDSELPAGQETVLGAGRAAGIEGGGQKTQAALNLVESPEAAELCPWETLVSLQWLFYNEKASRLYLCE